MHKLSKTFLLFVLALVLTSGYAYGHGHPGNSGKQSTQSERKIEVKKLQESRKEFDEKWKETRSTTQQDKKELVQNRCENVTKHIETVLTRFENNQERHTAFYEKMKETISGLVSDLKEKGYDVSKVEAALATLAEKIQKLSEDHKTYIDKLKATKEFACGESEGDFAASVKAAREALQVVREDVVDIRNFYQTVLRKEIKALREQKLKSEEE